MFICTKPFSHVTVVGDRRGVNLSPRGLIAFDLDGTLVHIGSAWSWIHRLLGTLERAKPYAEQYFSGKIDYAR